ncbi:MAG TPA: rhodanese-like domain-containing protein, partial [Pseudolabrys sp.]
TRPVVVACRAGHDLSQMAVAQLRADGFDAQVLAGGYEGWVAADLPFVTKPELDRIAPARPSLWVTRRRPRLTGSPARG